MFFNSAGEYELLQYPVISGSGVKEVFAAFLFLLIILLVNFQA